MLKDRPIEARTRRGNRIYRNRFLHRGEVRYGEQYSLAVKKNGERHRLNLGPHLEDAKKLADQISAFLAIPSHTFADLFAHPDFECLQKPRRFRRRLRALNERPLEKSVPSLEDILTRYEANAVHISPTTVKNNTNAIRHLASCILGLAPVGVRSTNRQRRLWREKTGRLRMDEFTLADLEAIRTSWLKRAGTDGIARGKVATTLNSYFRCARSIFSERMMAFYSDFDLPDPLPFRQIRPLREPSRRYVSRIDVADIVQKAKRRFWNGELNEHEVEARRAYFSNQGNAPRLKSPEDLIREDKARFMILLLTISCGLRPKEISRLTWDQIDFQRRRIHVAVTSYDTPKARTSESSIDVSESVLAFLREFQPFSVLPPFVIPAVRNRGKEPEKPGNLIFKGLCRWLRENGVVCENPLYVFRKEAGSIIYELTDSYDRAADFLRNDPRIAREHYVGSRRRLEIEVPGLNDAALCPNSGLAISQRS